MREKTASFWPFDQVLSPPMYARTDDMIDRLVATSASNEATTATNGHVVLNNCRLVFDAAGISSLLSVLWAQRQGDLRHSTTESIANGRPVRKLPSFQ